ncbi:hypothetical protein RRG08_029802 [Elysia crispata]|uniref:Uncharacterized protein n=1 Tax=Elysia crispata TaxID=231223 RepID=A0AAE1D178_9GAST|nr:hypothetical protein RRG08_029802 [Elysia crispata]
MQRFPAGHAILRLPEDWNSRIINNVRIVPSQSSTESERPHDRGRSVGLAEVIKKYQVGVTVSNYKTVINLSMAVVHYIYM